MWRYASLSIDIFTLFSCASEARARLYKFMIFTPEQIYCINNCSLESFQKYVDQYVACIASIKACLIINKENFQKNSSL